MSWTPRPSLLEAFTKAPAIAIAGPSGCGKTESAMRLARGYCGPTEKFVVLDTEEKRALYKKKRYQPWDWIDFQPPFTPERTKEALQAVAQYRAVILDSGSAEYAGEGGISDIAEDELERMAKGDPDRMEKLIAPSWKNAKRRHKHALMSYIVRYPTLLIVCLRAEPKVKFVKIYDEKKRREVNTIVDAGYQPICEKMFMYEMLVGCKMAPDKAGIPEHIKKLEPDLEPVFVENEQISEHTGERLRAWAEDRQAQPKAEAAQRPETVRTGAAAGDQTAQPPPSAAAAALTTIAKINEALGFASAIVKNRFTGMVASYGVPSVDKLSDDDASKALAWLKKQIDKEAAAKKTT